MKVKIKVMIVDDHQLVLDGIKSLIVDDSSIEIVGDANNGEIALKKAKLLNPDVVLMDIDMPVMNGIEATTSFSVQYPNIKILVLTMHNEKGIINKVT